MVTKDVAQNPLELLDPTHRDDTASHADGRNDARAPEAVFASGFVVFIGIAAISSMTGCSAGFQGRGVAASSLEFGANGSIPNNVQSSSATSSSTALRQSSPFSSPSLGASRPRPVTVDNRSAVAAWRSSAAHIDSEILANTARCSIEMALVDGRVCVDRWEGSIVERLGNGEETTWSPFHPVDGNESRMRAVSRPGVIPQGYISGDQAARACAASGKRLCSADEWESACRGPRQTQFPYGNERKARVCNDDIRHKHPVVEVGMLLGIPESRLWYDGMNQPLINQLPNSLLETGARAECTNDYGVFDMVGNLHEWISDPSGTFRGGYYMDTTLNGDGCSYATTAHGFTYHDYSTGFRCCADPDHVE